MSAASYTEAVLGTFRPTLHSIRLAHAELFHPNQDWFDDEAFSIRPAKPLYAMPTGKESRPPNDGEHLPSAVDLAQLYIHSPNDPIWRGYLWTGDFDSQGQRVYVGGLANGKGFEIHRHLTLNERWAVPLWT